MRRTFLPPRQPWSRGAASLWWARFGTVLALLTLHVGLHAQRDASVEELTEEAALAFEAQAWGKAHRAYAELLSLNGTSVQLQMRYAATLLHDERLRVEGIQRLASLAEQEVLQGEGLYWWGRSWMLQGRPLQAASVLEDALSQAEKKSSWRTDCQRALDQCRDLPTSFSAIQKLKKLDVVEVPRASFHRYVQWSAEGVRLMTVPQELQSKRDKKEGVKASVALQRNSREVLFHSLGPKAEQGLDIWVARLNDKGEFDKPIRLPNEVNGLYDEVNPVWDESSQCLTFGSNRPGTLGGMDIFRACKEDGAWTKAMPLGPSFNSVHDDLAYYPCIGDEVNGWLVTTRAGQFGAAEVWEVTLDGIPATPLRLKSTWDMGEEDLPGTLTLFDAQSDQALARVDLQQGSGQWDLVVSSGQVIHYVYETTEGIHVEGTYALPESAGPATVEQHMTWSSTRNDLGVSTRKLDRQGALDSNPEAPSIAWGWDVVLDDIPTIAAEEWSTPDGDVVTQMDVIPAEREGKRIVKFQSFPWWTELQKEERDIAASILSGHTAEPTEAWPEAADYSDLSSYLNALSEVGARAQTQVLQSIVSRAAADVIMEDMGWREALQGVLDGGAEYWETTGWPRAELERKASRIWAEAGTRFDAGLATPVRDKRGLVGDRKWVDEPWTGGTVVGHLNNATWSRQVEPEVAGLAWSLANQSARLLPLLNPASNGWMDVRFWQAASMPIAPSHDEEAKGMLGEPLREALQLRLDLLDAINPSPEFDSAAIADAKRTWQEISVPFQSEKGIDDSNEGLAIDSDNGESDLRKTWERQWAQIMESEAGNETSQRLPPWRRDMMTWLEGALGHESRPRSLLQQCLSSLSERLSMNNRALDPGRAALSETIAGLSRALVDMAETPASVVEGYQLLEAIWLMNVWIQDEAWMEVTLDQVLMELDPWPELVEAALPQMRVDWAQARVDLDEEWTREGSLHLGDAMDVVQEAVNDAPGDHALVDDAREAIEEAGGRGIHLGWFKNRPQVRGLPEGTRLVHEEGKQGLKRWVLLMEDARGKIPDEEALTSWLASVGVPDAYEVQWDGMAWGRVDLENRPQPGHGGSEKNGDAEVEAIWASGKPVELSRLNGTWHAVQVGVFSGEPHASWLSAVGGRLVKEPLPDGRAKWFVATSRDATAARVSQERLRNQPSFADAFLVRLDNGKRNLNTDDVGGEADSGSTPAIEKPKDDLGRFEKEVTSAVSIKTQNDDRRRSPDVSANPIGGVLSQPGESQAEQTTPTLWHVAIATYNGQVPANEVAAFLIKSAEWGVRSVELFGQTTYYSRSFVDLKEAQQMLMDVQSEGFAQAQIKALN